MRDERSTNRSGEIRCLQLNLQHSRAGTDFICSKMNGENVIALIQEPWVRGDLILGLRGAGTLYFSSKGGSPRASILVTKDISAWLLPQYSDRDCTTIIVRRQGLPNLVVSSIYLPHEGVNPPSNMVRKIVTFCEYGKLPMIMGGDVNAHHIAWGSTDINSRGIDLNDFVLAHNLMVANIGDQPTFTARGRKEVLDATFTNRSATDLLSEWKVADEESFSDHRLITFILSTRPITIRGGRYLFSKTKWDVFKQKITEPLPPLPLPFRSWSDVEATLKEVNEKISKAIEVSTPYAKASSARRGKVPWSKELDRLKKKVKQLSKSYHRSGTNEEWDSLADTKRKYKNELRKAKRSSWRTFCEECETMPQVARLNKIVSMDPGIKGTMLRYEDGSYTSTPEEALDYLLASHFPEAETDDAPPNAAEETNFPVDIPESIITVKKIQVGIRTFGPNKSAGIDGINPLVLRHCETLYPIMAKVFKACLRWGKVPAGWKQARVVFIPKPGKASYDTPKSFRPICLTSFWLKTLERLVDWYIKEGPLLERPLHPQQHAYLQGRSTDSALHQLISRIEGAVFDRGIALAVFIDIQNAFNMLPASTIGRALDEYPIHSSVKKWMKNVVEERHVQTELLGVKRWRTANRGTPQGGVLSPIIFNMSLDGLLRSVTSEHNGIHIQAYADDVTLLVTGDKERVMKRRMQSALETVWNWGQKSGLTINPDKTEVVVFTLRKKWAMGPLRIREAKIPISDEVKYLGITMTKTLTWNRHIADKLVKSQRIMAQCRRVIGKSWGLNPRSSMWLYKMIVRPIMAYGCLVWANGTTGISNRGKLSSLQRSACLSVSGAMVTTPTAALEAILGLPPLDLHLQMEAILSMLRIRKEGMWREAFPTKNKIRIGHVKWLSEEITRIGLNYPVDEIPAKKISDSSYTISFPSREEWSDTRLDAMTGRWRYCCFTDGSKMGNMAGAGMTIRYRGRSEDHSFALGEEVTVFQAEAFAINRVANELLEMKVKNRSIRIFSDSQACLKALNARATTSRLISCCAKALDSLGRRNNVQLYWIPAHVGLEGNEAADLLAKKGTELELMGPGPTLPMGRASLRATVDKAADERNKQRWRALRSGRQSKEALGSELDRVPSKKILNLTRPRLRNLIGMLTGHCRLDRHLHLMKYAEDATCKACGAAEETPDHFLARCPAYCLKRLHHLGEAMLDENKVWLIPWIKISRFAEATGRLDITLQDDERQIVRGRWPRN